MYEEHPSFYPAPHDAVLWRHMNFTKFVSLLDKGALFFARSDKLGDPFEGSYPKGNVDRDPSSYSDPLLADFFKSHRHFVRDMRPFTLVNSWHESLRESAAMWKLYAGEWEGISIRTDFRSLSESFIGKESIFVGRVSYIDFETGDISESNSLTPFLQKRKSFEHESEVRAVNVDLPIPPFLEDPDLPWEPTTLDLSKPTYETGAYRDVDISRLIHEVIVAPYADYWFVELVKSVAFRYGLQAPIRKSSLADEPTWG